MFKEEWAQYLRDSKPQHGGKTERTEPFYPLFSRGTCHGQIFERCPYSKGIRLTQIDCVTQRSKSGVYVYRQT